MPCNSQTVSQASFNCGFSDYRVCCSDKKRLYLAVKLHKKYCEGCAGFKEIQTMSKDVYFKGSDISGQQIFDITEAEQLKLKLPF